ncbi:MAG: glycosyltransferase family 39 protein, partial [Chloroflexota bacterium]|nr:glycosyltransferase family 39 protein [Chloroflexota bacterium]
MVILLFAAFLRFHHLGTQSLWYDEGNSYVQSIRTFTEIADNAARDIHPPGYYWLLATWRLLTGESEFALRSLSAFASILTVALTFAVGRRLFGGVGGLIAAAFTALNTFSIYYAQEARMYALLSLWGTASLYTLIRLLDQPTRGNVIALGLLNAAGLWTQYAFPFFMIAQGVITITSLPNPLSLPKTASLTARRLVRLLAFAAANILAIALFAAWLPTALNQITTWTQLRDVAPLSESLPMLLRWLAFGITADTIAPAIVIVLLLFGLRYRRGDSRRAFVVPIASTVVPVGVFLALGLFREANLKFLLPAQVGMALWLARGIVGVAGLQNLTPRPPLHFVERRDAQRLNRLSTWRGDLGVRLIPSLAAVAACAWMIVTLGNGIAPLYDDSRYQRPDYRAVAAAIASDARADDAIILDAPNQAEVFGYYYAGDLPLYPLPAG